MRLSVVDEIEADVGGAVVRSLCSGPCLREQDRLASDVTFRQGATLCEFLHGMAIPVTSGKIHLPVHAGRIFMERLLHQALRFDKLAPVHRRQEPETADAVAHGDLIDRLLLRFRLHQLLNREAGLGQALFDPGER